MSVVSILMSECAIAVKELGNWEKEKKKEHLLIQKFAAMKGGN